MEIAVSLADKLNLPATLEHAAPIVAKFSGRQLTVTMLLRILGLAGDWLQLRICQKQSQVKGIDSDVVAIYNCFVKRMTAKVREQWYSTKAIQHRGRVVVSRLIAHARPGLHGDPRMPASSGDAAVEENGAAGPSCPGDAAHPSAEGILRGVNTAACAYWRQLPGAVQKSLQSGEYGAPEADIVRPAAASAALGGPPERAGGEAELLREIRGETKADILPYKVCPPARPPPGWGCSRLFCSFVPFDRLRLRVSSSRGPNRDEPKFGSVLVYFVFGGVCIRTCHWSGGRRLANDSVVREQYPWTVGPRGSETAFLGTRSREASRRSSRRNGWSGTMR